MSISKLGIASLIIIGSIALLATMQHQSQVRLRQETAALREQVAREARLAEENERLSNVVAQAKVTQTAANEQFQELIRLRRELGRISQEKLDSNRVDQAKLVQSVSDQLRELSGLRSDVSELAEEVGSLREDLLQLHGTVAGPLAETSRTEQTNNVPGQAVSIRMIETHAEAFAEKLKNSASAQEGESFEEVFGRFLRDNGIETRTIAGLAFDERTGRVIVRAPRATLDLVERVTLNLDRTP